MVKKMIDSQLWKSLAILIGTAAFRLLSR